MAVILASLHGRWHMEKQHGMKHAELGLGVLRRARCCFCGFRRQPRCPNRGLSPESGLRNPQNETTRFDGGFGNRLSSKGGSQLNVPAQARRANEHPIANRGAIPALPAAGWLGHNFISV